MKYVKVFGLAAVAVTALGALFGAGAASATVLCTENKVPCPVTADWPAKTPVDATLESSTSSELKPTGGFPESKCADSTLKGETENTGAEKENVRIKNTELTFKECSSTTVSIKPGRLTLEYIEGINKTVATIIADGVQVTVAANGVSCVYGTNESGVVIGLATGATLTGVAKFEIEPEEAVLPRVEGSFICPADATWSATYTVTEPTPLYFKPKTG